MSDNLKQNLKDIYNELSIVFNQDVMLDTYGVEGFNFIIPEETTINLSSNITDYVLENNTMVQSGIALQPITINLRGKVGELYLKAPLVQQYSDNPIQTGLNEISSFAPRLSASAQQYYNRTTNIINKIEQSYDKITGAYDYLQNLTNNDNNKQQRTFSILETIWKSRTPFKIITCYREFNNCVLEQVSFTQSPDTSHVSDISMTIKIITFTKNITSTKQIKINQIQKSETQNNGTINISIAKQLINNSL